MAYARGKVSGSAIGQISHDIEMADASEAMQWTFDPPKIRSFEVLTKAPVFHPSRSFAKPSKSNKAAVAKIKKPKPVDTKAILSRMILVGTMVDGNTQKAVLKRSATSDTELIARGDTLNGWTITRISEFAIHLSSGGEKFALRFPDAK